MEKKFEINLSEEEIKKVAKLNDIDAEKVDSLDVEWTVKLLLQRQK